MSTETYRNVIFQQKGKEKKREKIEDLWAYGLWAMGFKRCNTCVVEIPEGKGRENRMEDIPEVLLAKNLTKSMPPNHRPRKPTGRRASYTPRDPHSGLLCWSCRTLEDHGKA